MRFIKNHTLAIKFERGYNRENKEDAMYTAQIGGIGEKTVTCGSCGAVFKKKA